MASQKKSNYLVILQWSPVFNKNYFHNSRGNSCSVSPSVLYLLHRCSLVHHRVVSVLLGQKTLEVNSRAQNWWRMRRKCDSEKCNKLSLKLKKPLTFLKQFKESMLFIFLYVISFVYVLRYFSNYFWASFCTSIYVTTHRCNFLLRPFRRRLHFCTVRRQIIASIPTYLLHCRISWAPGCAGQEDARQGPPTCPINCQTTLIPATCYKGPLSHTATPPRPVTLLSVVIKCLSYASLNIAVNPNCTLQHLVI